jgi:hypothetical protein
MIYHRIDSTGIAVKSAEYIRSKQYDGKLQQQHI